MIIAVDDIWLCSECMIIAVNGDASGLDYSYPPKEAAEKLAAIEAGLTELGPHLVPVEGEEEFSRRECDCCGDWHHGTRHEFAILGEESDV